jgi:N-formylmaleamate deformylase
MNRRDFLFGSAALGAALALPQPLFAQRGFRPTRFSVQVRGRGPDVILIPGLASSRAVWNRAIAAVPGYRYHLIQVAGFAGEPTRGNASGAIVSPLAEEIAGYIRAAGLRRPAIVGHSMGGTLGMMIALRHPNFVGRLMVVDMLPRPTQMYGGAYAGNLAAMLAPVAANPIGRNLLSGIISAFTPAENEGREGDADVIARSMRDLGAIDLGPQLRAIRAPMTVVYAVRNAQLRALTERDFTAAYRPVRGVRMVPVYDSGHLIMSEQPARFAAALRDFLR